MKKKLWCAVIPAFILAVSVGQIYAFTNFSTLISDYIGHSSQSVQFAFSLSIFFLGMGAAFFGKIVEKNIRLSTIIGIALFISGLCVTGTGIWLKSLPMLYLGYGVLVGLGTGVIYISPVKTMMLWFANNKALAAAIPIISFGLGSTLSTIIFKYLEQIAVHRMFFIYALIYLIPMSIAAGMLKKPQAEQHADQHTQSDFTYGNLLKDRHFLQYWLFMFLNISCGLCLIPLAKQMMSTAQVGYSKELILWVIALCGVMNGAGRLVFAWWSDRLTHRIMILLIICAISIGMMTLSIFPIVIGLSMLIINSTYGAGFSCIPGILADHYGMSNISKIHGAVLSAWGVAGLVGNQLAILVYERLGFGYIGVVIMLIALYTVNLVNVSILRKTT